MDGLENAIVAAVEKNLDAAVKDGKLTQEQATEMLDRLRDHVDELVQHTGHGPRGFRNRGMPPDGLPMPGSELPGLDAPDSPSL